MKTKIGISVIFIVLMTFTSNSQNSIHKTGFPNEWIGNYKGKMYILNNERNSLDSVDVVFKLHETTEKNKWTYVFKYSSQRYGNMIKDYLLVKPDSLASGVYLLDEKNGIIIQQVLMGNTFFSNFTVAESHIFTILRKNGEYIEMEVTSSKKLPVMTTRNHTGKNEKVFEIKSMLPYTTQFAILKKVD